jgi:hypothetical protein
MEPCVPHAKTGHEARAGGDRGGVAMMQLARTAAAHGSLGHSLAAWIVRIRERFRTFTRAIARRVGAIRPDQWFLFGFALLLLLYLAVLLVQPSSVGRGGR